MSMLDKHREGRIDKYVRVALQEKETLNNGNREMSKDKENYDTQRIDQIREDFKDLKHDIKEDNKEVLSAVTSIRTILVGNGSEGIIAKTAKNSAKIKIILWTLSVMVGAIIGSYYKTLPQAVTNEIAQSLISDVATNK